MNLIRVTGSQLAAARALARLTRQELAARAGLSYHSIRSWERSSNAVPACTLDHLSRALAVLEAEGVVFTDNSGVSLRPSPPAPSTTMGSEEARP